MGKLFIGVFPLTLSPNAAPHREKGELFAHVRVSHKYRKEHLFSKEKGEVNLKPSSLTPWFLFLFWLNILDILVTNPAYESNPVTLYMWGKIGFFLSAWIKIGLVLSFGFLCAFASKVAKPDEWLLARKLLLGILMALVAFYMFVVAWNMFLFFSSSL